MPKHSLTFLILIILLTSFIPLIFAQERGDLDKETQSIGLERFIIKDVPLNGGIESLKLIDLNQDGIKEIICLYEGTISDESTSPPAGRHGEILNDEPLYLEIFSCNQSLGKYDSQQVIKVPADVVSISIGNYLLSNEKEIAFYNSDGVFCYNYSKQNDKFIYTQTPTQLIKEQTIFQPVGRYYPAPVLQEGEDINNDGIDDLIIPTKDGYLVCWGPYYDGKATRKQIIWQPPSQSVRTTESAFITISSSLPNISLLDLNGDNAKDIILGFNNKLSCYSQDKTTGLFPEEPSGEFHLDFLSIPDNKNGSNVLLYSNQFADINADGIIDLIVASTSGDLSNIGNLVIRIFIFIASPFRNSKSKEYIELYPSTPAQVINIKGVCPLWCLTEINGDAYPDLFITSFKVTLASNIKKAIFKYIPITYQIYLNRPPKMFSGSPEYEQSVNFPVSSIGKGTGFFSHIYLGYDFNNDSRTDLFTISGPERKKGTLAICTGRQKGKLTHKDGISFEKDELLLYPVRIPDKTIVSDLNNDKKTDIILQYKSRITVLISR